MSASQAVLGALLLGADPAIVEPEDFSDGSHRRILNAIKELRNSSVPIDLVSVSEALGGDRADAVIAAETLEYAGSIGNVAYHVSILKRERQMREIKQGALSLMGMVDDREPPEAIRATLARMVEQTHDPTARGPRHISQTIGRFFLLGREPSVPLGLEVMAGLRVVAGELCVFAARPGQGKTAMLGTIALAAARAGWQVLFASLEMPADSIHARFLAAVSGLPLGQVLERRDPSLLVGANEVSTLPLYVEDDSDPAFKMDLEGIGALSRVFCEVEQDRPTVLLVDYLQYVRTRVRYERRNELLGYVCRELKAIAKTNRIPVIAAAQLNRAIEQRGSNPHPQLSDLRESGDIENTADEVVLMHRSGPQTKMLVAKYRQGEPFLAEAFFDGPRCQFVDPS